MDLLIAGMSRFVVRDGILPNGTLAGSVLALLSERGTTIVDYSP